MSIDHTKQSYRVALSQTVEAVLTAAYGDTWKEKVTGGKLKEACEKLHELLPTINAEQQFFNKTQVDAMVKTKVEEYKKEVEREMSIVLNNKVREITKSESKQG